MTISPLALKAKKVIDAAWLHGDAYDLSSQAAFALESAQLLQSPETAAELERLRREAETNRIDGQRLIRAEQRRAELEAVLGTHRKDDQAEIERLRARVAELEAARLLTDAEAAAMWDAVDRATPGHIFKYEYQRIVHAAFGAVGIPLAGAHEVDEDEGSSADKLTQLLAPTQALQLEDPHDSPLHHTYLKGRDLPQTGGTQC